MKNKNLNKARKRNRVRESEWERRKGRETARQARETYAKGISWIPNPDGTVTVITPSTRGLRRYVNLGEYSYMQREEQDCLFGDDYIESLDNPDLDL